MWPFRKPPAPQELTAHDVCRWHFGDIRVDEMMIVERTFPLRVRADLQLALNAAFADGAVAVKHFCGVASSYHQGVQLADCVAFRDRHQQPHCTPPQYQELDVGDAEPVRSVETGLWMLEIGGEKFAFLVASVGGYGCVPGMRCEVGGRNSPQLKTHIDNLFRTLQDSVNQSRCYRGKILSLERSDHDYSGQSGEIKVHRLRTVERDDVILPAATLALLDRNVIGFVQQRDAMKRRGLSTRKGLLFYGPPGTGKTHTIHYLSRALPGHTVLIITAEQVAFLDHYMTLARLLQPSIVVLEDVDLIARDRNEMNSACEEVLLNKLLNQMDGLQADADVLFILTSNRPEALEQALAGRPGRVDQAIEFPLPDIDGRRKLARMYAGGIEVSETLFEEIARRTAGVSAAFLKELMRRAYQFHLEASSDGPLSEPDVLSALDELLFSGGSLNRKLLGAEGATSTCEIG